MERSMGSKLRLQTLTKTLSEYCEDGLWECSASPTGAHHWIINGSGMSYCKYCRESRRFNKESTPGYEGSNGREWYDLAPSKGWLKDLVSIA